MKLHAYLSQSRHGVFYFRWPLTVAPDPAKRRTVRLSLRTRCPKVAGRLARDLSSCGQSLMLKRSLRDMRYDELQKVLHSFFKSRLADMREGIAANGPPSEFDLAPLESSKMLAEASPADFEGMVMAEGKMPFLRRFCALSGLPVAEAEERPDRLAREIQAAWRAVLAQFETDREGLASYDFSNAAVATPEPAVEVPTGETLQTVITEYLAENRRSWVPSTHEKRRATLAVLAEVLGEDTPIATLTKAHAREAKAIIAKLPPNRNKLAQTKNLPVRQVAEMAGLARISTKTLNDYLAAFRAFFQWAVDNGHLDLNIFDSMQVANSKQAASEQRQAFKPEALQAVYNELTLNTRGLVKKDSQKWATLIGMFSGARLNEICQLLTADVQQQDGIWFFNLADDEEEGGDKRFKTEAGKRKVPVHAKLIELGFLDYHCQMIETRSERLFPEFSYEVKSGYGRQLGRWFNDVLTERLGIKSKAHVFHGLRHTVITRLLQADVAEAICQSIVGHSRKGVTQAVYNREGYKLSQLKEAIDKFQV